MAHLGHMKNQFRDFPLGFAGRRFVARPSFCGKPTGLWMWKSGRTAGRQKGLGELSPGSVFVVVLFV